MLALMAEGKANSAIAAALWLAPRTVESHVRSIFAKLGLTDVSDADRRVLGMLAYLNAARVA